MTGDVHKHMRSTVLNFVSGERLRTVFLQDADQLAPMLTGSWKEGEVISAKEEATKFSLYIMVKKILSMKSEDADVEKLTIEYESFLKGLDCIPVYMPGTIYWKALQHEHIQIVRSKKEQGQDSKLTSDDIKKMDFTRCVINEMLRLGNVVSFSQRKATADAEYKGYTIPEIYTILINLAAVHLDPSIYEDPGTFNPWRWKSSTSLKVNNTFMLFGGRVRLCPGAELAKLEMSIFHHHLMLKYDWEITEPDHQRRIMVKPREAIHYL